MAGAPSLAVTWSGKVRNDAIASPIVISGSNRGRSSNKINAAAFAELQMTAISNIKTLKVTLQCGWMDSARQYSGEPRRAFQVPLTRMVPMLQPVSSTKDDSGKWKQDHKGSVRATLFVTIVIIALSFALSRVMAKTLRQSETWWFWMSASSYPSKGQFENSAELRDCLALMYKRLWNSWKLTDFVIIVAHTLLYTQFF